MQVSVNIPKRPNSQDPSFGVCAWSAVYMWYTICSPLLWLALHVLLRLPSHAQSLLHSNFLNIFHLLSSLILHSLIIQPNGVIKYMMLSKQGLGVSVCCCWKHIIDEEAGCHYQPIAMIMYLLYQCYSDSRKMDFTFSLAEGQERREISNYSDCYGFQRLLLLLRPFGDGNSQSLPVSIAIVASHHKVNS